MTISIIKTYEVDAEHLLIRALSVIEDRLSWLKGNLTSPELTAKLREAERLEVEIKKVLSDNSCCGRHHEH